MGTEELIQTDSVADLLLNQIEVLLSMLMRPAIQRQIVAGLVVLFLSWVLPELFRWWRRRRQADEEGADPESAEDGSESLAQRWVSGLYNLFTPILALLLLRIAVWLLDSQGYPKGLLENFSTLIWIWMIYRALVSLLYIKFGIAIRPYQIRIITPVFVVLIISQLISTLPGSIALGDVELDLQISTVTLGRLATGFVFLYVFIVSSWVVEQFMVRWLPGRVGGDPGVVEAFATLVRYALIAMGIIAFLSVLGLDLTSLAIVAGGLSVGIGIGLQDLVANFVSGLVLLFEQSLKPGDVIELEGRISKVEKVSLRATIVRTRTNEELIIPNASFTTNQVKNLTKSDRLISIVVPFGVSYRSDPELVRRLAIETAMRHPLAIADPPPRLLFKGYGDSSIDFNWIVSITQPEELVVVKSDLYYMLWKTLAEHNITIPFPQRDLNLGDGWEQFATDLQAK